MLVIFSLSSVFLSLLTFLDAQDCFDSDNNCADWVASNKDVCTTTTYITQSCRRSCGACLDRRERAGPSNKFDISRIPSNLQPIAWLVGIWRSEHGGKAIFPTIPKFTFGEEIQISISDIHMKATPALNYTAFAWSAGTQDEELHSETGYITIRPGTSQVALTTVMNNGFVTVEEGPVSSNRIRFRLIDIGRISFSRDLPVHDLVREWILIDSRTLESRLDMETLTHGMQEHTANMYTKIFP